MNKTFSLIFSLALLFLVFSGCGKTVDLYGESRMERIDPIEAPAHSEEQAKDNPHRNYKPAKEAEDAVVSGRPGYQSDYSSAGIFKIIPPAQINPRNLEEAPDPQIITIDFQKGYSWLSTIVLVNDEIILQERLRSNALGFADTVSFKYAQPPARFTLVFPTLNLKETFTVDPEQGRFLGISLVNGQLSLTLQEAPFFYDNTE